MPLCNRRDTLLDQEYFSDDFGVEFRLLDRSESSLSHNSYMHIRTHARNALPDVFSFHEWLSEQSSCHDISHAQSSIENDFSCKRHFAQDGASAESGRGRGGNALAAAGFKFQRG